MKRVITGVIVMAAVATLLWLGGFGGPGPDGHEEESVAAFLTTHWQHPIPPQGEPPAAFSALEASLGADACGQCHGDQYADWSHSLHSQTMGPGIQWQLRLMDQGQANKCLQCHAPLAEQKALVALQRGWPGAPASALPAYVPPDLADQGVACAVCHVRGHERFGPPPSGEGIAGTAHGGFAVREAYGDSRFCAGCHQFPEDGPRLNGKLQENTLNEWLASPHAPERTCQSCHMPDRKHQFRGIHDPDMVRAAVDLTLNVVSLGEGRSEVHVSLANVGAGHHFPTYMVPKVYLNVDLVHPDAGRTALAREVIGWMADVSLTRELFDTRIPSGEALSFSRRFDHPEQEGWQVEARLEVAPREHYERTFEDSLTKARLMDDETVSLLKEALREAYDTRFEALRVSYPPAPETEPTSAASDEREG